MEKAQIIPSQLQICVERLTKEIAKQYINTSTGNRRVTTKNMGSLSKEFHPESWIADCGQGIIFDINGELVDGHTRLLSFINSPLQSIDITVIRGVNVNAKLIFDTGRKRTNQATLAIHGVKHASRIASVLSLYAQYLDPNIKHFTSHANIIRTKCNSITNSTIMRVYESEKPDIDNYASFISNYNGTKSQMSSITPRIITFVGYILYKQAKDVGNVFDLIKTVNLGVGADVKVANFRNAIMQINPKRALLDTQKIDLMVRMVLYISGNDKNLVMPKSDMELKTIRDIESIIL